MIIVFVIIYEAGTGFDSFLQNQTDFQEFLCKIGISYFALTLSICSVCTL